MGFRGDLNLAEGRGAGMLIIIVSDQIIVSMNVLLNTFNSGTHVL